MRSKTDVMKRICERLKCKKKEGDLIYDAIMNELIDILIEDDALKIPTLGLVLKVVEKPALPPRKVRSPRTGEMIDAPAKPASKVLKVRAVKELKTRIN